MVRPEGTPGRVIERFLRHAAFEIVLSTDIAEVVHHSLAYAKVLKAARSSTEPELWFEDILVLALMTPGEHQVSRISADPDDDKYVAAAIEGRAAFVVSRDTDLVEIREHQGIRFVTPRLSWIFWSRLTSAGDASMKPSIIYKLVQVTNLLHELILDLLHSIAADHAGDLGHVLVAPEGSDPERNVINRQKRLDAEGSDVFTTRLRVDTGRGNLDLGDNDAIRRRIPLYLFCTSYSGFERFWRFQRLKMGRAISTHIRHFPGRVLVGRAARVRST